MQIGGIRWFFYMHAPNIQRIVRLTCCSKVLKHTCIWLRSCDQLYNANHEHACTYSIKATAEQRVGWHRRWLVRLACCSAVLKNSFIWLRSYDYSMAVLFSESLDGLAGQAQCPQTTAEWRSGLHRRWVVWPARPDRYMHRWHQSGYRGTESWSTSTSSR